MAARRGTLEDNYNAEGQIKHFAYRFDGQKCIKNVGFTAFENNRQALLPF